MTLQGKKYKAKPVLTVVGLAVLFLCYAVVLKIVEKTFPVEEGEGLKH